ncbi:P-loop NTPase family protein [Plectonema cf. radiosum LEGE 06105]|uniref:P-loop NTPase family protein n=1 Tax=Plectonema cf. radiosum LEGE 06105 TaxID=945769 RepID=A0A8J7F8X0_9CYAN|nr:P-loop NTPase family protein [Plectonema radiosum]MBE9211643.1 P-loop NTPase family protein [Plectonema cf. radiosum LEGE 06105]
MVAQLETLSINSTASPSHTIKGLVKVFTSSYRSFFTSVMAQALRIAGQGTPVLIVQFLKGGIGQGQDNPIVLGQNLHWIRCNLPRCIDTPHLDDAETEALHLLWQHTLSVVNQGKYSLVVLDELSLAMNFGLIPEAEVLEFLANRPQSVDIMLTGAEMPKCILDLADEITEIRRPNSVIRNS